MRYLIGETVANVPRRHSVNVGHSIIIVNSLGHPSAVVVSARSAINIGCVCPLILTHQLLSLFNLGRLKVKVWIVVNEPVSYILNQGIILLLAGVILDHILALHELVELALFLSHFSVKFIPVLLV